MSLLLLFQPGNYIDPSTVATRYAATLEAPVYRTLLQTPAYSASLETPVFRSLLSTPIYTATDETPIYRRDV